MVSLLQAPSGVLCSDTPMAGALCKPAGSICCRETAFRALVSCVEECQGLHTHACRVRGCCHTQGPGAAAVISTDVFLSKHLLIRVPLECEGLKSYMCKCRVPGSHTPKCRVLGPRGKGVRGTSFLCRLWKASSMFLGRGGHRRSGLLLGALSQGMEAAWNVLERCITGQAPSLQTPAPGASAVSHKSTVHTRGPWAEPPRRPPPPQEIPASARAQCARAGWALQGRGRGREAADEAGMKS